MQFIDLDTKMRVFETSSDYCVLPEVYMVARLDGRCFTKLTKEVHEFKAPYDPSFRDFMVATIEHLMHCGFNITYAYTQSDEISLLFSLNEMSFQRKLRKINSVLAGEASSKFSLLLGSPACFDCRISELPNLNLVVDYFRWRNEDANRNALNAHCYWILRSKGLSGSEASSQLSGVSVSDKNELLFQHGINFNELSNWQKRGVGLYWELYEKEATNKKTQELVLAKRRRIKVDFDLPMKDEYSNFITNLIC